jgi:O-antigen/teichoic acid export membrane protein
MEALPIGIVTILSLIYFKIDTVILSILKENTDVGIYGTAYKILEILMALPIMFVGTIFPSLSEAYAKNDRERLATLIQKSFDVLSIGSLGVSTLFFAYATPIIGLVAGREYLDTSTLFINGQGISSNTVLQILIIAVGINFFNSLFTNSLITFNRQKELIKPYVIATIFNLAANFIFIPHYSYIAAAVTTVLTELLILILCFPIVRRISDIKIDLSVFYKTVVAGICVLIVSYLFRNINFVISAALSVLAYVLVLYFSKAFSSQTIKRMMGK